MQIRTIILIITFIGSILAALVAALITNQRVLQAQADAEARWGIYNHLLTDTSATSRKSSPTLG